MAGNPKLIIKTPRGEIFQTTTKSGKVTAKLTWNPDFGDQHTGNFTRAQKFLDSEVLRTTTPFVPIRTGALIKSGQLGTVIGSGQVTWNVPYARRLYYSQNYHFNDAPQRGGKWFERSKATNKPQWIAGVKKIAGGSK
ncbi:MAG: minor capsid protein [Ethanoligenens sp.]